MATRTIANGGGNWNSTGTWVEASVPVAGDDVVATGTSGQVTVNVASVCATLILTGYTSTLTFNSTLTVTSTVTFVSGMTIAGTGGTLICNGTATLTSAGKTLTCILNLNGAVTYTLADNWTVNGLVSVGSSANNIVVNGNTLNCAGGFRVSTSGTVTGTTLMKMTATGTWSNNSTGSLGCSLEIAAGGGTVTMSGTNTIANGMTLTYTSGTFATTATPVLKIGGNATIPGTMGGTVWPTVSFTAACTLTLTSDLSVSGTLTIANANCVFAGAFNVTCATLTSGGAPTAARTHTFVSGQTYTITSAMSINGTSANHEFAVASTPGTKYKFILGPGATHDNAYFDATDCDASLGQTIFSYKGTPTTCINWATTLPYVQRRAQSGLGVA